jgi:uncharacterized protein (DUF302 family)
MIATVQIERFSLTSRPFDEILAAIKAAVGHPDMVEFAKRTAAPPSLPEFESIVREGLGTTGLMLLMDLGHGALIRKATRRDKPRMARLIMGNPLIMQQMARHVPDAGSYAPVTVLVDERSDGVHISYDRMASLLASYGSAGALAAGPMGIGPPWRCASIRRNGFHHRTGRPDCRHLSLPRQAALSQARIEPLSMITMSYSSVEAFVAMRDCR